VSILDRVTEQLTLAMRQRDAARLAALRNMRAAFLHEMKKDGASTLSDDACVIVLRRLEKQRRESIAAFRDAGREDRAAHEDAELGVIQEFLPRLADEARTRAWVEEAIAATGARAPGDVGRVMGAVMKAHKGEVDGALAREIAQRLLSA
jgi:uncharacterized protein